MGQRFTNDIHMTQTRDPEGWLPICSIGSMDTSLGVIIRNFKLQQLEKFMD